MGPRRNAGPGRALVTSGRCAAADELPEEDHGASSGQRHGKACNEAIVSVAIGEQRAAEKTTKHRTDHTNDDVGQATLTCVRAHDLAAQPACERTDDEPHDDSVRGVHCWSFSPGSPGCW